MSQPPAPPPSGSGWGSQGPSPYETATAASPAKGGGRRRGLLVGGAVVAVAAVAGGGVWAATAFFATGDQAAEALPADTVAYVGFDLDPSGGQKLEALRTLEKFPILDEQTSDVDSDTDLRRVFFDVVTEQGGGCEGLDYDDDLAGWLGDRAGVGVLPGDGEPDVVGVVQVTDAGAAEDGLETLVQCAEESAGGEGDEGFGYVVDGDWAVVAEDDTIARAAVDGTDEGSLADADDFTRWVDAAGDPGILTAWAGPGLADEIEEAGGAELTPEAQPLVDALGEFEGAALTLRFADEGLELQTAVGSTDEEPLVGSDVTDVTDGLPSDTAALLAADLEPGWAGEVLDRISEAFGVSRDTIVGEIEAETGIAVPDDVERLLGEGFAIAVSSDIDAEGLADGSTPPDEAPVGVRVVTDDPEASEDVLDQLRGALPDDAPLDAETGDDLLVVSPDQSYRAALLEGGDLGSEERFGDVLPMIDRSGAVFYLDLDVLDDYSGLLDDLSGDQRVSENLEPLAALGLSSWTEDDATLSLLRIGTD